MTETPESGGDFYDQDAEPTSMAPEEGRPQRQPSGEELSVDQATRDDEHDDVGQTEA